MSEHKIDLLLQDLQHVCLDTCFLLSGPQRFCYYGDFNQSTSLSAFVCSHIAWHIKKSGSVLRGRQRCISLCCATTVTRSEASSLTFPPPVQEKLAQQTPLGLYRIIISSHYLPVTLPLYRSSLWLTMANSSQSGGYFSYFFVDVSYFLKSNSNKQNPTWPSGGWGDKERDRERNQKREQNVASSVTRESKAAWS